MTTEQRLVALATAMGTDVKSLRNDLGALASLNTTAKTNLVAAINEVKTSIGNAEFVADGSKLTTQAQLDNIQITSIDWLENTTIGTGLVITHKEAAVVNQVLINGTAIKVRSFNGTTWSTWTVHTVIADTAADTVTDKTYSIAKINQQITTAVTALETKLVNGSPTALDTLKELATALNNDPNFATTLANNLNNKVDYSKAQTLTAAQQLQACNNIGIGNPDRDLVAVYNAAKV